MNATDELHKLLDERGVEWDTRTSPMGSIWTYWYTFNGYRVYARDNKNGTVKIFGEWDVTPAQAVEATLGYQITEDTSDGWHSFKDLYHHRALLFSVIVHNYKDMCWKSKHHHDGKELDWNFIVGIDTPWGQASYHYGMDYWDMFDCKVLERAPYYDGYTADESVARIAKLVELEPSTIGRRTCHNTDIGAEGYFKCSECGASCSVDWERSGWGEPNFCPSCGKKVTS